jgi:Cu(I)-responsive transcriptional regulator
MQWFDKLTTNGEQEKTLPTYPMNIGEAAAASSVSAKMIRHYESIGLIPTPKRTLAGYRTYSENDIHILRFVHQARNLGFPIRQIGQLLGLWHNQRRSSGQVKALAVEQIHHLDEKIAEMQSMKATLEHLALHCHGDERPECPILEGLAGDEPPNAKRPSLKALLRSGDARGDVDLPKRGAARRRGAPTL